MSRAMMISALLAILGHLGHVSANISTSCKDGNTRWVANYDGLKDRTASPLSGCQETILGLAEYKDTPAKYKIGGKGNAEVIGISAGSSSKGCSSVSNCMYQCQALCCMTTGCKYAMIYQDKDVDDYIVYKETTYTWYCEMYSKGTLYDKDDCTVCRAENKTNCASIANSALGLSTTDYNNLVAVQNATTCPSGRRQLRQSGGFKFPTSAEIDGAINSLTWGTMKAHMRNEARGNSFLAYIESRVNKVCTKLDKQHAMAHGGWK